MCLILMAYKVHPRYPLIVAANRDEYYDRPTATADFWEKVPTLYAGRDLAYGGTWLGVTRQGRLAALTNYRDPSAERHSIRSRGHLVSRFLESVEPTDQHVEILLREAEAYNGYNLLFGTVDRLLYFSNKTGKPALVERGIHGLSNHLLDTPWPKVARGKERLARLLEKGDVSPEDLLAILADSRRAPDEELPSTGVSLEIERLLSPIFIASPRYGTRASTVLFVDHRKRGTFVERSFGPEGKLGTKTEIIEME